MEQASIILQVIQNLKTLFADKDRLVGIEDWDIFIGCIIALEGLKADLQNAQQAKTQTEEE